MITIKCFGAVWIEGADKLPDDIKIISDGLIRVVSGVIPSIFDSGCYTPIKEGEKE